MHKRPFDNCPAICRLKYLIYAGRKTTTLSENHSIQRQRTPPLLPIPAKIRKNDRIFLKRFKSIFKVLSKRKNGGKCFNTMTQW
jgi:hypothetical protein